MSASASASTESARFRFIKTAAGARLVYWVLAATILVNPIAFVEPSPYEGMVLVLAVTVFAIGQTIDRRILPLLVLLTIWAVSGFFALMPAFGNPLAVKYYEISVYLMVTAVLFASLFAEDTVARIATLSNAYIVAAVAVSLVAIAAFFDVIPSAQSFLINGRASSTFKDPNVFAPYLILPLLMLIERMVYRRVRLIHLGAILILLFALFLSFSRGAWGHFVFSAIFMIALFLLTERTPRFKRRLAGVTIAAIVGVAALVPAALSFSSVRDMFAIRAELLQDYDTDSQVGRFTRQSVAVRIVSESPNGLGPFEFARHYGQDIHNVYLNAFVSYGWAGGIAYLAIVVLVLKRGFRALLRPSPWRPFLIAAYSTFVGLAGEGMIIDTDHWRHFFLLVGIIWGLGVATEKYHASLRRPATAPAGAVPVATIAPTPVDRTRAVLARATARSTPRRPTIEWSSGSRA